MEVYLNKLKSANIRQWGDGGFCITCTDEKGREFEITLDPVKGENLKLTFGDE